MAGFILAFTAALFITASSNPITYEQEGHLQIIDAENGVLEAVFFTRATGIRISGDPSSISIVSMSDDEVLMSGSAPNNSSRLYRVLGSNFFKETTTDENGERRKHQYVVPESLVDQAKEESEATRKEQRITSHLTEQSESEFQTAQERAFQMLFLRQEISLIVPAAKALGRAGVMGYENQGALNFYGVAMALAKHQGRSEDGSREGSGDVPGSGMQARRYYRTLRRTKRRGRWWGSSKIWCDYSWSYCDSGTCTMGYSSCNGKCPDWTDCVGRCGPGCWWCWWFACWTCCYQQGCYEHDVCCGNNGYISTECAIPLGFSCSGYTC